MEKSRIMNQIEIVKELEGDLEAKLPKGHSLDTNSQIVAIYGPNYSGKTALMRMIATSLYNHRIIAAGGSQLFEGKTDVILSITSEEAMYNRRLKGSVFQYDFRSLLDLVNASGFQDKIKKCEGGSYNFAVDHVDRKMPWVDLTQCVDVTQSSLTESGAIKLYSEFKRDIPDEGWYELHWEENVLGILKFISENGLEDVAYGRDYFNGRGGDHDTVFFNDNVLDLLTNLNARVEDAIKSQGDWTYVKPNISNSEIYTLELGDVNSAGNFGRREGHQRHTWFNPKREPLSSGKKLQNQYRELFDQVQVFFEEGHIERFKTEEKEPIPLVDRIVTMRRDSHQKEQAEWNRRYEHVSEDAQLVLMIDEPSAFLDPKNILHFRDDLQKTLQQYDRLQVFLASNDMWLLQNLPEGTKYLDFYHTPVKSRSDFSLS